MNISPNNEKVKKYLNELAEEYKVLLLKALIRKSASIDDLSVSELLRLDNEIKKPLFEDYQRLQRRRRFFIIIGLIYMLFGCAIFIIYEIQENSLSDTKDIVPLLASVISFMGVLISIFSFALPMLRLFTKKPIDYIKKESPGLLEYELIAKWRDLEGLVNDISLDNNVKTPRSIIDYLYTSKFIDEEESKMLKDFLKIRNNIVHSTDNTYSAQEIKDRMDEVDIIINRLKKII